jgi:hypothetical protein
MRGFDATRTKARRRAHGSPTGAGPLSRLSSQTRARSWRGSVGAHA